MASRRPLVRASGGNRQLPSGDTLDASVTGNAATATKLATARTLSWSGDVTGSTTYDGSANSSAALTLVSSGVTAGTYGGITVNAKGLVTSATATGVTFNNSLNVTSNTGNAGLRFGNQAGISSTPYFDFISGGSSGVNYDFRMIARGGTTTGTTSGTGYLGLVGAGLTVGTTSVKNSDMLTVSGAMSCTLPAFIGTYTLSTLPSASSYSGYLIQFSNASRGWALCRSNGTSWIDLYTQAAVA